MLDKIVSSRGPDHMRSHHFPSRLLGIAAMMAATFVVSGLFGAPDAHAEACSSAGLPFRTLESDEVGRVERQSCVDGEWRTFVVYYPSERTVINEAVEDPLNLDLKLDARSFFELKNYDPYAIVKAFGDLVAKGEAATSDERTEMRLLVARMKAQAYQARVRTNPNDRCAVRSRPFSEAKLSSNLGWLPPLNNGFPGQSQISYDFADSVPSQTRLIILNALDQYHYAVVSQDSALQYPTDIVPRDPADSRPATIHFSVPGDFEDSIHWGPAMADAKQDPIDNRPPGVENRWVSGEIRFNPRYLSELTPRAVGHEIGHVMGLDHLSTEVVGTMTTPGDSAAVPWSPFGAAALSDQAFDTCMFLPAERAPW